MWWIAALVLAQLFLGCATAPELVNALAKDPASNCIVVSTPYGGILVARATPGVRVNLAAGTCSVEAAPAR